MALQWDIPVSYEGLAMMMELSGAAPVPEALYRRLQTEGGCHETHLAAWISKGIRGGRFPSEEAHERFYVDDFISYRSGRRWHVPGGLIGMVGGEVEILGSPRSIATGPFLGSVRLLGLSVPDSVEEIEVMAFYKCRNLVRVSFGKGLSVIAADAFFGCRTLAEAVLPDGLKTIGDSAFRDCLRLESVTVPNGVEEIGGDAFLGCRMLRTVRVSGGDVRKVRSMYDWPDRVSFSEA